MMHTHTHPCTGIPDSHTHTSKYTLYIYTKTKNKDCQNPNSWMKKQWAYKVISYSDRTKKHLNPFTHASMLPVPPSKTSFNFMGNKYTKRVLLRPNVNARAVVVQCLTPWYNSDSPVSQPMKHACVRHAFGSPAWTGCDQLLQVPACHLNIPATAPWNCELNTPFLPITAFSRVFCEMKWR